MASQIDTLTFEVMHGSPEPAAETVEPIIRPGRDYARWRRLGYRAAAVEIQTVKFVADYAEATTTEAAYKALVGESVTVIDPLGVSYANCKIVDVRTRGRAAIEAGVVKIYLRAAWLIQAGDPLAVGAE